MAHFLRALWRVEATKGPAAGPHSFYRGGKLSVYDAETEAALGALEGRIDAEAARSIWHEACAARWLDAPVWVHGDGAPGNLLIEQGQLSAVIDFGSLAIGDPACDLTMA